MSRDGAEEGWDGDGEEEEEGEGEEEEEEEEEEGLLIFADEDLLMESLRS